MSIKDRIAFFNAVQGNANLKLEKNITQPLLCGVGAGSSRLQDKADGAHGSHCRKICIWDVEDRQRKQWECSSSRRQMNEAVATEAEE